MSVDLTVLINYVDPDVNYATTPANFIALSLNDDYLIWTEGDDVVKDLMTSEPTADQLNAAATIISDTEDTLVDKCLMMDYSHDVGGSYFTHLVKGMGENKKFVFGFSFNGGTATEPQLEAWDDANHNTTDKHVLGFGNPADSMVKAVCTNLALPGVDWAGTAIAGNGSTRIVKLNNGNGALNDLASGEVSQELYANMKIEIPQSYATPSVESFVTTIRYTWN